MFLFFSWYIDVYSIKVN